MRTTYILWLMLSACTSEKSTPTPQVDTQFNDSVFILNVSETDASWVDFAYLSSIPTSAIVNHGNPAVVSIDEEPHPATLDLLNRLKPTNSIIVNGSGLTTIETNHTIAANNASEYSLELASSIWQTAPIVVFASEEDYSGALLASSVASLLEAPLIFTDNVPEDSITSLLSTLETTTSITITLDGHLELPVESIVLTNTKMVIDWLADRDIQPQYLTVTNSNDRLTGRSQKASLVAPMFAANRTGLTIPISLEMPTETLMDDQTHPVVGQLHELYDHMGYHPEFLAIVGAHDALPLTRKPSIFDNPVNEHPVSDLPYGEVDDDPFLDIAIGRIVGDTFTELSNLATRISTYEQLQNGDWEHRFVESGLWGFDELRPIMLNVGYDAPEHLSEQDISAKESLEVGAILHKDHSYCQVLGHAFELSTPTLFAPAIVLSRGCSVGGMDLLNSDQRSIVDHMLGLGAAAFVGASRNAIAHNTIIEVSMWNHMLSGETVGQAFRSGINDTIVHWLDDNNSSALRYSLDIEVLFGDPAWELSIPTEPTTPPAYAMEEEDVVTIHPPEQWTLIEFMPEQLEEWNFSGDLFMYAGPGAIPKTYWSGSHDAEDLYYGVKIDRSTAPLSVTQQSTHDTPLGGTGNHYIDFHQDGSVSIHWSVRLIDYDMYTGEMITESPSFEFQIEE